MLQKIKYEIERNLKNLEIPRDTVYDLLDIVLSAFGTDFFDNCRKRKNRITLEEEYEHPLLNVLHSFVQYSVNASELLEIGLYLKTFHKDPEILKCIQDLKNPAQYESALYQLAMAYRLKESNCENIQLEPITDRGRSDILFEFGGKTYIAECYKIRKSFSDYMGKYYTVLYKELCSYIPINKKYVFTLEINTYLTFDGMRRLLSEFQKLIKEFNLGRFHQKNSWRFNETVLSIEDISDYKTDPDFKEISGGMVDRLRYLDANLCISECIVKAKNIFYASDAPMVKRIRSHRLYIWEKFDNTPKRQPLDTLKLKIGGKIKQTKIATSNINRLLFVDFPFGLDVNKEITNDQRSLQEYVVRNYQNVSVVFLTQRIAGGKNRFTYHGVALMGEQEYALPKILMEMLNQTELSDIFLINA